MGKSEIIQEIKGAKSVLILGHVSPDGDSVGCQLALAEGLEQLGKRVSIQSRDQIPASMASFDAGNRIKVQEKISGEFDLTVFIECPNKERCGFPSFPQSRTAGIDHHPDYALDADANWLDATSASTAELVFQLLLGMDLNITKTMAEALYLGIITDTGRFVYPNTKAETLEFAAQLIRKGVRPDEIFLRVYRSYPVARLDLRKTLLASMQRFGDDKIVLMTINKETVAEHNFSNDLFDDLVNMPLEADEVVISALARETEDGIWRFNLRSKGNYDIGKVAGSFGGGGHRNAAGFRSELDLKTATDKLVSALGKITNPK